MLTLLTCVQTVFALETVKDSQTTIAAMQAASKELKTQHAKINIDKIEDMNDDLADMFEDMNEISEVRTGLLCLRVQVTLYFTQNIMLNIITESGKIIRYS